MACKQHMLSPPDGCGCALPIIKGCNPIGGAWLVPSWSFYAPANVFQNHGPPKYSVGSKKTPIYPHLQK